MTRIPWRMADYCTEAQKVQDEPRIPHCSRKKGHAQRMTETYQNDTEASRKHFPLAKSGMI